VAQPNMPLDVLSVRTFFGVLVQQLPDEVDGFGIIDKNVPLELMGLHTSSGKVSSALMISLPKS
jgi:hypothetical protein